MTYLLAISIGPVQEFIAAGRRTNDLYAGSALISEIARAAATAVREKGGELIFPADPKDGAANKILAAVSDPKKIAEDAETAASECLRKAWRDAFGKLADQKAHIDHDLAVQQVNAFLEFYAAWWPWDGQDGQSYGEARQNAERLLAGRKALRDFKQPQKRNIPKSPLDPSRDTVVTNITACAGPPLRLKGNEWLDAVSVLKRVRGFEGGRAVSSTSDIAARTFLAANPKVADVVGQHPEGAVYKSRRDELVEEEDLSAKDADRIARAIGNAEPDPYFAILVADGDRMGDLISQMDSKAEHQAFSRKLAAFADSAKSTVESHQGHLVYSGGDDVLALLPVHTALACAAQLASDFHNKTDGTLSVGVAIVHYHEPLYVSLRQAREAESKAKREGRNRLALAFHLRGGQVRTAVWEWGAGYDYADWRRWTDAFKNGLSHGFPYELENLARETQDVVLPSGTLKDEALRIFDRKKKSSAAAPEMDDAGIRAALGAVSNPKELAELAQRLIIFRALARYPMQWEANS